MPCTLMDTENLIVRLYWTHLFNCFSLNSFKFLIDVISLAVNWNDWSLISRIFFVTSEAFLNTIVVAMSCGSWLHVYCLSQALLVCSEFSGICGDHVSDGMKTSVFDSKAEFSSPHQIEMLGYCEIQNYISN